MMLESKILSIARTHSSEKNIEEKRILSKEIDDLNSEMIKQSRWVSRPLNSSLIFSEFINYVTKEPEENNLTIGDITDGSDI